ncbi:GntR family transcriptional regulator [Tissierella sp. Yu-01]|uniref:GntR family transcriptional regulator n=1 Tax=Tissierella sp. Yu-01 TaxID=3035694 RepID=UPI00240E45EC|nr:GntR family transcriptional regulator [Tissierella sp. Yu-01]WFA08796.1 GntR family transcriptional regulator [Tissierella sp. Yu-01]
MRKVLKNNPLPLYYQLKEILIELIDNEELKPGDAIPTERELCEIHGISRMTARKAIVDLATEGIVFREQGRGTFVSEPKMNQQLSQLKSFTEQMREKGLNTSTNIVSFVVKDATKKICNHLNLTNSKTVFEIKRLRYVEDEPIAFETVWLPFNMCSTLTRDTLEGGSLYKVLRETYKYNFHHAKQSIEPIAINEYESKLLGLEPKTLALLFRRTTYLDDGRAIEYTKTINRSDKYKYEVVLKS